MVRQAEEMRYTATLRHRRQEERGEREGHGKTVRQAEETRYAATLRHGSRRKVTQLQKRKGATAE